MENLSSRLAAARPYERIAISLRGSALVGVLLAVAAWIGATYVTYRHYVQYHDLQAAEQVAQGNAARMKAVIAAIIQLEKLNDGIAKKVNDSIDLIEANAASANASTLAALKANLEAVLRESQGAAGAPGLKEGLSNLIAVAKGEKTNPPARHALFDRLPIGIVSPAYAQSDRGSVSTSPAEGLSSAQEYKLLKLVAILSILGVLTVIFGRAYLTSNDERRIETASKVLVNIATCLIGIVGGAA